MRGEFNGKRIDIQSYMVSVDEMILHDEDDPDLANLQHRMEQDVIAHAEENGYMRIDEDVTFSVWGKPLRAYDEYGDSIGEHVIYMAEIRVVPLDTPSVNV